MFAHHACSSNKCIVFFAGLCSQRRLFVLCRHLSQVIRLLVGTVATPILTIVQTKPLHSLGTRQRADRTRRHGALPRRVHLSNLSNLKSRCVFMQFCVYSYSPVYLASIMWCASAVSSKVVVRGVVTSVTSSDQTWATVLWLKQSAIHLYLT